MDTWIVPAVVERIIDGDTIVVVLDLGWNLYKNDHVRLAGINAPEKNTPEGITARDYLSSLIKPVDHVMIHSHKLDKYGRCLATVLIGDLNVNQEMINAGHAIPYMVENH